MTATTYQRAKYYHENRASILKDAVREVDWATMIYRSCFGVAAVIYGALSVVYFIMGGWAGFLFGLLFLVFCGMFLTFAVS